MPAQQTLTAAHDLHLHLNATPHWRLHWRETDWLGPLGFAVHHNNRWYTSAAPSAGGDAVAIEPQLSEADGSDDLGAYRGFMVMWSNVPLSLVTTARAYTDHPVIVLRIEAPQGATGHATGEFAQPSVAWTFQPRDRIAGGVADGTRSYGHQYTEFALPVTGDANAIGFLFAPHRPPVVEPLLFIAPDLRTIMLAPLDHFHEQIIGVPRDADSVAEGVRCGWHGDLSTVPPGFATELAIWAADSPRAALDAYAALLRRRHATQRPTRYADVGLAKLSYWTDNGAVYYYRTEPECDYLTTLGRVVEDLHAKEIPVQMVQLDSWFYPHQNLRAVSAEGAPLVPPSGMMTWEPRADLFPDGFGSLQQRVGGLPLAFHSRHFSKESPYFERHPAWVDGDYAHPTDDGLTEHLIANAATWGAITYEQDWMVESFLGVRGLREQPGRARAWQEGMDRAAGEHGLTLQWCMSTPADFLQTVTLHHLTSIRTSGDYRYLFDNGLNWVWFLHVNAFARALGLHPFKDIFLSHGRTSLSDGEPYAEVEALLASLSTGPVGIGDQLGCTNRELVMRTCREDGVLIKPDVPLAALDRCFLGNCFLEPNPLIGETYSAHPAGVWRYVVSFNAWRGKQPMSVTVPLAELGATPNGDAMVYDWRRRTFARIAANGSWECTLGFQEWDYRVVCPLLPGEVTVFGDVSKYAAVGDRRVRGITVHDGRLIFDVEGAPNTLAEIHGYARTRPSGVTAWLPAAARSLTRADDAAGDAESWTWEASTGLWVVRVRVGEQGQIGVQVFI